ncbi:hypothetical protein AOLI_G00065030 [Acnodon oligacanthus]
MIVVREYAGKEVMAARNSKMLLLSVKVVVHGAQVAVGKFLVPWRSWFFAEGTDGDGCRGDTCPVNDCGVLPFSDFPTAMAIWTVFLFLGLFLAPEGVADGFPQQVLAICHLELSGSEKCFRYYRTELTWTEAENECVKYNGNLASVHSLQENAFLQNFIKLVTGTFTRVWLGATDNAKEGTWLWSDGSKMNYQNWGPTQPSNYLGKENCLEINYGDTLQWNDDACDVRKPFICHLKKSIPLPPYFPGKGQGKK